jgi:hypothetical protein
LLGIWGCRTSPPAPTAAAPASKQSGSAAAPAAKPAQPAAAAAKPAASSAPAAAKPSAPAAATPTASTPAGAKPAGAAPAGVAPAGSTPAAPTADAQGTQAAPAKTSALAHADEGIAIHGSLVNTWRKRDTGSAHDQDIYNVLAVDVGDASRDRVTGHFLGRLSTDIDGRGDSESQLAFSSIQDSQGKTAHFDLYEASVDVKRPFDAPLQMRVGRQIDYATPEFAAFDGVRLQTEAIGTSKVVAGGYVGVPVRYYGATTTANQIEGAWAEAQPWTGGRVRGDWMHVHQEVSDSADFYNDLLGLTLWQRLGSNLLVDGRYTALEEESRDVSLRATWQDEKSDLMVQAGFFSLLNPQRDYAGEFDPYYSILQEYEPYSEYRLLVSKNLWRDVRLDLGGDLRTLDNSSDESRLNHDYERGYATVVISDIATHGLDLSLTGDAWNSSDQDIRTWGVDLTWKPNPSWRASAGSAYALYKYDVAQNVEEDNVRSWYLRMHRMISAAWSFDLAYTYDNDDFGDYQEILAGATWHF